MARRPPRARARRYPRLFATAVIVGGVVACSLGGAAVAGALVAGTGGGTSTPIAAPTTLPEEPATPEPAPTPTPTPEVTEEAPPAEPLAPPSPAERGCDSSVTMSVWAHYDDDLIFMNPVLAEAIARGDCVRTLFLTGSDAGAGDAYAKGRELGILRAYNTMIGEHHFWEETPVTLLSGAQVSQWSPIGMPEISVAFLRLPDGNLTSEGFPATGHVSLPRLISGSIPSMTPLYGGPALTTDAIVATIAELIGAYHADRIYTHVPLAAGGLASGDHPDHSATGTLARAGWQQAGLPADAVQYVVGYPTSELEANVSGDALTRKIAAFRVYAAEDSVVRCTTDESCLALRRFGPMLLRHHSRGEAELFPAG